MDTDTLSPGDNIYDILQSAIADSDLMLLLASPTTLESNWVQYEVSLARSLGKSILPVPVDEVTTEFSNIVSRIVHDVQSVTIVEDTNTRQFLGASSLSLASLANEILPYITALVQIQRVIDDIEGNKQIIESFKYMKDRLDNKRLIWTNKAGFNEIH